MPQLIAHFDFMTNNPVSTPAIVPSIAQQRKNEQPMFAREKMLPAK